jgi:hypothetical protein
MAFTQEFSEIIEVNGFGFVHGSTPDVKGNVHRRTLKGGGTVRLEKAQDSACWIIRIIFRFVPLVSAGSDHSGLCQL